MRGFQADGCGAEFFATDSANVISLPPSFTLDMATMMEPAAVAIHAVERLGDIKKKNLVVMGAGTIGNLIAQTAQAYGAHVLITDIHEKRLSLAKACDIAFTANLAEPSLSEHTRQIFGKDGFAIAVEASGAAPAIQALIPSIRKGIVILIIGVFGHHPHIDLATIGEHELEIKGSMM